MAAPERPSAFLVDWREALTASHPLGPVLDLACGRGRNALPCADWGARVVAMDRNVEALRSLRGEALTRSASIQCVRTDLETPHGIPLGSGSCGAVLIFRFLYRPLVAEILRVLRSGGLLLAETFTQDQKELPHGPSNPAFLLDPGELRELYRPMQILHHDELPTPGPRPQALARLAARKP